MTERLEQLNHRYEELSAQLSAPETYNDPALAARLNREQRELEPGVQAWRDLAASERELAGIRRTKRMSSSRCAPVSAGRRRR